MNIDIKKIAKLARIYVDDKDAEKFEGQMQEIVNMVENLPDIENEPLLDPDNPMKLREDKCEEHKFSRQELMQNAPKVKAGCLVVPKTVE